MITLDADGPHAPAEVPTFLRVHAERPSDPIIGARDCRQMPPVRRLSPTLGRWILSAAVGRQVRDHQPGTAWSAAG